MVTYVFPGQGSQVNGMGVRLFDEYPGITEKANEILGYSIKELCLNDPQRQLNQTQYTQPALYTVNVLSYLTKIKQTGKKPDYLAGHSLGEYSALFASGVFNFETGLKLVKKRGELMSQASGGGMAAILGLNENKVEDILKESGFNQVEIANYNTPTQIVISGNLSDINNIANIFDLPGVMFIPLNVSGAFHSSYMREAKEQFEIYLDKFVFSDINIPVIANISARPYRNEDIKQNLAKQITHSVRWTESIRYLMGVGVTAFEEIGPGDVLSKMIQKIQKQAEPLIVINSSDNKREEARMSESIQEKELNDAGQQQEQTTEEADNWHREHKQVKMEKQLHQQELYDAGQYLHRNITATTLGDEEFKNDYNLTYAYVTGSMYRGISSKEMIVTVGKAGMMGFFGTGGLELHEIKEAIKYIKGELTNGQSYGMNLLNNPNNPQMEERMVDLYMELGVKIIEASAYMSITPALIRYRAQGLKRMADGTVSGTNRIIAKVSRPEVAGDFLSPAPERVVENMLVDNKITREQAVLLREIPMADDLIVEADSGGHTDAGVAYVLMPVMIKLRDDMMKKFGYRKKVRVGAAGGIGTPEAAAAAFILGADFIVTGSINQCTIEAGTSDVVKDLLQQMNVQDTDYAPAGDMFELGAKVQVLRKGLFFPARANKLYSLYRQYNSLDEIDAQTKMQIEDRYFRRSFHEVYEDLISFYPAEDIERAESNPKQKMALIFKWYLHNSTNLALNGSQESKVDYQIYCGPALGAFNQWVKGTHLEDWRNRHVDEIGKKLMAETACLLNQRLEEINSKVNSVLRS